MAEGWLVSQAKYSKPIRGFTGTNNAKNTGARLQTGYRRIWHRSSADEDFIAGVIAAG